MIAVYKTTVSNHKDSKTIVQALQNELSNARINFDLQDCDKILRVEAPDSFDTESVEKIVAQFSYKAKLIKKADFY